MGSHWRNLVNTTEPSMFGGNAALSQITLATCYGLICVLQSILDRGKILIHNMIQKVGFIGILLCASVCQL